jgi:hypothetical protein
MRARRERAIPEAPLGSAISLSVITTPPVNAALCATTTFVPARLLHPTKPLRSARGGQLMARPLFEAVDFVNVRQRALERFLRALRTFDGVGDVTPSRSRKLVP